MPSTVLQDYVVANKSWPKIGHLCLINGDHGCYSCPLDVLFSSSQLKCYSYHFVLSQKLRYLCYSRFLALDVPYQTLPSPLDNQDGLLYGPKVWVD